MESIDNAVYLSAVRFGGYPEMVRGMADAMYGGGQICIHIGEKLHFLKSHVKQYRREFSHDGIYAEATLMVQDEEQSSHRNEEQSGVNTYNRPRKCYLFCERGDSDRLFEELDKKTAVPLIPKFRDYVLSELQKRKILQPLVSKIDSVHILTEYQRSKSDKHFPIELMLKI